MTKHRLLIKHQWALGDTVLMTALVRDIHLAYPGQYEIEALTNWTPIWWNNPHVTKFAPDTLPRPQTIEVGWGEAIGLHSVARTGAGPELKHILAWYHYDFERRTGIRVPVSAPRPDLHLTAEESVPRIAGRYWVVMAGGKLDVTIKHWGFQRYQAVVDKLTSYGLKFVQCGGTHSDHVHPPMTNCLNMVGKTDNVRDLFNIIKHAEGVICPVTGPMHIAAAFERPCVVIAGGREEPWFEAYVNGFEAFGAGAQQVRVPHKFLHTLGKLHCCGQQGCWKKRVVPIREEDLLKDANNLCKEPIRQPGAQTLPACMDLITVEHVVEAVMQYYDDKILPAVGATSIRKTFIEPAATEAPPEIRVPTVEVLAPLIPQQVRPGSLPPLAQRPNQIVPPLEIGPQAPQAGLNRFVGLAMDNPIIGGKFTVCVLCWGNNYDFAKKCLTSIMATIPRDRIDLRVACNECCDATLHLVKSWEPDKLYLNSANKKKYPTMREMFWDSRSPIKTQYVVWFDDDTQVVDADWAGNLANVIIANHPHGSRLYGAKMHHDISMYAKNGHHPHKWFAAADWWQGAQLRVRGSERYAPNGSCIDFVAGWFWAIATEAIRLCNIPDLRLLHNGGDITIGAQVHQHGYKIKNINEGKSMIFTPPKELGGRRVGGYEESFLWVPPEERFERTVGNRT